MIPVVKRAGGKRAVTSTVSEETERPLRADARRNRERILQSARAAFAESGADAQIDDVARHAGVGVGTVYRHFPTNKARTNNNCLGGTCPIALWYVCERCG